MKTGTHLGQNNSSKNIFLGKFQCNSTRNVPKDNLGGLKNAKFDFCDDENEKETPKMDLGRAAKITGLESQEERQ